MQIRKILLPVAILFGCIFISCNNDLEINKNQEKSKSTGIISGKVLYSNLNESQNAGIIVTLDKTDGLRTDAVTRSVAKRSIISSERTIVSNSVTRNDGSYLFENLEPGTYTVYAASSYSKEKAVCTNVVVRSAEETVADVMTLTATGSIKGKITLDEGNSGNTGFLVFIAGTSYMAITDDAGNYTISDVPAGSGYQLVVMKNNVMHFLENNVVVNANSSTTIATNNFTSKELKASDGKDGADGTSIVWLGSFEDESEIENPQYLNAYFNMKDGCSYIYDGTKWTLLSAKDDNGTDGKDGENGSNGTNGKDALAIGTVLNTEELTNQNVIITVNITKADISKIGYVYFADKQNWNTANSVFANSEFISLQPDSNGKYQVVADKNGYYAFAVKNSDGYSAFTEEYITNIDKTAPAPVSNLIAKYNKNTKVLSVTWTNPTDSDFDYAVLGYSKGGETVTSNIRITNATYSLSDVEVDGDQYVFTVYVKDKTGNTSNSKIVNIIPVEGPKVQSITLSRYHWAYNDPDQTVTVTAIISNADLIEDGTVVKFQTKDPSGNVTNTVATLDKTLGTAVATITAPVTDSAPNGTTYYVLCKIGDENANGVTIARFNVSSEPYLDSFNYGGLVQSLDGLYYTTDRIQINLSEVEKQSTEIIRIEGYNLDLTTPSIQLYNSNGEAYFENPIVVDKEPVLWNATRGDNYQVIDTIIPIPTIDECYTIKILFNEVEQQNYIRELQVYDVPKFLHFEIPIVGISRKGNAVIAKINGKNFEAPNVDLSDISAFCNSNPFIVSSSSFTKINDSVMYATFTIPDNAGEYEITIQYAKNSITATLKAGDYSLYSVGDVLLNDGTIVHYNEGSVDFSIEQIQKAIGVLYDINEYGVPRGYLGIHNTADENNRKSYEWHYEDGSDGYNTKIEEIICDPDHFYKSGTANSAIFTGDTQGSNNWNIICSIDAPGTEDAITNYPAFYFANNYAKSYNIIDKYANNWYIPSLAELCYIYRHKDILNTVLDKIGGIKLFNVNYWTSSLSTSDSNYTWFVDFSDGSIKLSYYSQGNEYVCCIHPFE